MAVTPTAADVAELEAGLPAFLRASLPSDASRRPHLADRAAAYLRQYVGYVDDDGTPVLWGNFFCDVFGGQDWRTTLITVDDGGDCYFQVEFLPAKHQFRRLQVNGEA